MLFAAAGGISFFKGEVDEGGLAPIHLRDPLWRRGFVGAIGFKDRGATIVGKRDGEDFVDEAVAQGSIFDRENDFNAAKEVSRHPIRAAHVDFGLAAVFEIKDAAMFEESINDAANSNVFAEFFHARTQAANAADDQIDAHPGLRRFVKREDYFRVHERIHFRNDPRGNVFLRIGGFAADQLKHAGMQFERSDEEFARALKLANAGKEIEEIGGVFGEIGPRRHESNIGVKARSAGIVIAGAEVNVAANDVVIAAHH